MKKKIYSRVTAVIITITAVIMVGAAGKNIVTAAESRQIFMPKSYGRLIYDDNDESNNNGYEHDLLIDASDFAVIAEKISGLTGITDELVKTTVRKNDIINTIEKIKENNEKDKVVGANALKEFMQAFQDGVNKIYNKLAGLGFTPANNSPDGINYAIQEMYGSRYSQGYTDGLGQAQSANAQIRYTYHQHVGDSYSEGGCYTIPVICNSDWDYTGQVAVDPRKCKRGHDISYRGDESNGFRCKCVIGYDLSCGMDTDTIVSAVIEFIY